MSDLYYYVCDNCGSMADISEKPHDPDGPTWACAECDSKALWEFTDKEKAKVHAFRIMDSIRRANGRDRPSTGGAGRSRAEGEQ